MASAGKPIRIFLADGEPVGILLAEISNWTGKVLVASRSQFDQRSQREEVRRTGVYLLVGPGPDDPPTGAGLHRRGRQRQRVGPRSALPFRAVGGVVWCLS